MYTALSPRMRGASGRQAIIGQVGVAAEEPMPVPRPRWL